MKISLSSRFHARCRLVLLVCLSLTVVQSGNGQTVWNGSVDREWAESGNWTPGTVPVEATNVVFSDIDSAAAPSVINSNLTISSLRFAPTASGQTISHTIQIEAGSTLSITGSGALDLGSTIQYENTSTTAVFTGGGALNINNTSGTIDIATARPANGSDSLQNQAVLDLRDLASFTATTGTINISSYHRAAGRLHLSNTANDITANIINVGNTGGSQNPGTYALLNLGAGSNNINVGTLHVGGGKHGNAVMEFGTATGSLNLSATTINVGVGTTGTGAKVRGTIDLRGHDVDATVGTMTIGNRAGNTGSAAAIGAEADLWFDTGSFQVSNLAIGTRTGAAVQGSLGKLHIGGGLFEVNEGGSFVLASNTATNQDGNATGQLNLTGGIFRSHVDVTAGTGNATSVINLTGGVMDMAGNSIGSVTDQIDTLNFEHGTLMNVGEINGGAGLVVTGNGVDTLILDGVNTYTGGTTISAGSILQVGTGGTIGNLGTGNVQFGGPGAIIFDRSNLYEVNQAFIGGSLANVFQSGEGRTILSGNHSGYAGKYVVEDGILQVATSNSLGTGGVTVNSDAAFYYMPAGNSNLSISSLTLQDNAILGVNLGSSMDVTGSIVAGLNTELRLFQQTGQVLTPGVYDVITAAGGGLSSTTPRLLLFNVTDYSVILNDSSNTGVSVEVFDTAPQSGPLYWMGHDDVHLASGVAGYENVWAVSDGIVSNWTTDEFGFGASPLVPGEETDVMVAGAMVIDFQTTEIEMSLGADMTIRSLTFDAGLTQFYSGTPPLSMTLRDDLHRLSILENLSVFETFEDANGKMTIDIAELNLANVAPVVHVDINELEIRAILSGNGFTKTGVGTVILSGDYDNTYTGDIVVEEGELHLNKAPGAAAISGNLIIGDGVGTDRVRLLAADQFADTSNVHLQGTSSFLTLNGHDATINELTGVGRVQSSVEGTATLTIGAGNGSSEFDGIIENGGAAPILLALTKAGTGTITLNRANSYGGATTVLDGVLRYGTNNVIASGQVIAGGGVLDMNGFHDSVGQIIVENGGRIIGEGSRLTSSSNRQMRFGEVEVSLRGSGGMTKSTDGLVILSGDNKYTGRTSINGGILRITSNTALGAIGTSSGADTVINGGNQSTSPTGTLELANNITVNETLIIGARNGPTADIISLRNLSGNNTWAGGISFTTGGSDYYIESQSGLLHLAGTVSGRSETTGSSRNVRLRGAGDGLISGVISDGVGDPRSFNYSIQGTGTWTFAAANTYTGFTDVDSGVLRATHKDALSGTSRLTVKNGAAFEYQSGIFGNNTTNNLNLNALTLAGTNRVGVELGNLINVNGAAITTGANVTVDVFGISGATYTDGRYDVIRATSGLNGAASYTLGNLYNVTNFLLSDIDPLQWDDQNVWLNIQEVDELEAAWWKGGFSGGEWAATNGSTTSNWASDAAGTVTALVPGAGTDVTFSAVGATGQDSMSLGANMSMNTITFTDGTNLYLEDVAHTVTLNGANALTVTETSGDVVLNAGFILANGTPIIDVAGGRSLTLGWGLGGNGFDKIGSGTLVLSGGAPNTFSGLTRLLDGLVQLQKGAGSAAISGDTVEIGGGANQVTVELLTSEQIANSTNVILHDNGVIELNGNSEEFGSLTGTGTIVSNAAGTATITLGANDVTHSFGGSINNGANADEMVELVKIGTGTVTLNGANTLTGNVEVLSGELRLGAGGSLGVAGSQHIANLSIGVATGDLANPARMVVEAGGELRVGNGADSIFEVGRASPNSEGANAGGWGVLDMSEAENFVADVGRFLIGVEADGINVPGGSIGVVHLAENNTITASTEFVLANSPNSGNQPTGGVSTLTFGSGINTVTTPLMIIGGRKSTASANIEAGGRLILNNGLGATNLFVATNGGTAVSISATFDLSGGAFEANLDQLMVGQLTGGTTGSTVGEMILGSGNNQVTANSVVVGDLSSASGTPAPTTGTLEVNGGNFNVTTNITLGRFAGSAGNVEGRLNIYGGTVTVGGDITTTNSTRSTSIVDLDGGRLDLALGDINVDQFLAKAGELHNVGGIWNGSGIDVVANTADLEKISDGTLRLLGNNGYTGQTVVSAGTLLVNGSHTNQAGNYIVANGATLGGIGNIVTAVNNSVTIQTGGKLAVGDSVAGPGIMRIATSGTGALVFEDNSFLDFDITGGGGHGELYDVSFSDQLRITGTVDVGEGVKLRVTAADMMGWVEGDTWKLFDWVTAPPQGGYDFEFVSPFDNLTWDLTHLYTDGTITLAVIPEPTKAILLLFGIVALVTRRNRNSWRNRTA